MNYELAKQLKDAGFPFNQKRKFLTEARHFGGYKIVYAPPDGEMLSADYELVPTLSELLEACCDDFENVFLTREGGVWKCQQFEGSYWGTEMATLSSGTTPEEAVANLWIALNKKD